MEETASTARINFENNTRIAASLDFKNIVPTLSGLFELRKCTAKILLDGNKSFDSMEVLTEQLEYINQNIKAVLGMP